VCSLRLVAEFDIRAVEGSLDSPDVELGDKTALTMPLSPKRSPGNPDGVPPKDFKRRPLSDLLIRHLRLPPSRVIWVPNGFDAADIDGLTGAQLRPERNGQPLRLVMNGYWYGRNGPGILRDALQRVGPAVAELTVIGGVSPPIAAQLTRATGIRSCP
jgi:hypothetical protein